jgi:glycosyltransferase involved in cell wall biosynthesis
MKTAPLVSVVTPFYNTEAYLAECIESVLTQTYQNWEYTLINNCSTDRSPEIARQYIEKDRRLRLLHNEQFLTQVQNYNHALSQILPDSKYCKIVQADDWIFPNCLEEMVGAAESAPNVALVGSYTLVETRLSHGSRLPYTCHVIPGRQMLRRYLAEDLAVFGSPTCVMYRTSDVLARCPFFDVESPVDDIEACFHVLQKGDFAFVHQVLTFNRRENESIWSKISRYNPQLLYNLILTYRYGPKLFLPDEYKELLHRIESEYYWFLGHAVFEGHPRVFWEYHAQGLATVRQKIHGLRFAWYLLKALLDLLGNPKATLGHLLRGHGWNTSELSPP